MTSTMDDQLDASGLFVRVRFQWKVLLLGRPVVHVVVVSCCCGGVGSGDSSGSAAVVVALAQWSGNYDL